MSRQLSSVRPLPSRLIEGVVARLPGVGLCALLTVLAFAAQALETRGLGHPYVEALVLAIFLGMIIRAVWKPPRAWQMGIAFSAKQLLELAVMLLGASLDLTLVAKSGTLLLVAIVVIVALSLGVSYSASRLLGLPSKLSILVACGNSICGNSAIAAVAPVIGASSEDVGASISFTAILGILTVIGLPLLVTLLGLSATQYGILAGLTVYAVPQVLAATLPVGLVSTQIGTFVKLARVLLLGPIVVALSLLFRKANAGSGKKVNALTWVPWFVPGFLLFAAVRSAGLIPQVAAAPIAATAGVLTISSMAALGLSVDLRLLARIGPRVTAAVTASLLFLIAMSLLVVRWF
ncbi:YeiH family protein [Bradyrhizobium sp.]|uniref:YeiH family protein n=1 Tax=Bradyrhizobium sp. TaxID=376 RepID=UPI003C45CAB4